MELRTAIHRVGETPVLDVSGHADLSSAPRLYAALRQAVTEHAGELLLIDLDGVTGLDDAALGLLLGAAARATDLGGGIELICTDERLRNRLTSSRIDELVSMRRSIAGESPATAPARTATTRSYTAVIFSSLRTGTDDEAYEAEAAQMARLAAQQPGYRGLESVRGHDGSGITVSYWDSEGDARAWKQQSDHLLVQRAGRERWYEWYRVRVATVGREYSYDHDHVSNRAGTERS